MHLFQVLNCTSALGNCCKDYELAQVLIVFKRAMELIQLFVPIILLIWAIIKLVQLVINPDEKNGLKVLTNKFLAAMVVFFVPVIVNMVLSLIPSSFSIAACWNDASHTAEDMRIANKTYLSSSNNSNIESNTNVLINSNSSYSNNGRVQNPGSAKGQAIVDYAMKFVGKPYLYGGTWNGELPYTPTDCSGFVKGVFKHNGIQLQRGSALQWNDKKMYTLVSHNEIRPGDVVMYQGHVGILTGRGAEIVHAKCTKCGIVVDPDYRKCSKKTFLGIMRIKGVN